MGEDHVPLTFGYCRVSTPRQNLERQVRNIRAIAPNAIIYQEKYTGTEGKESRKEWAKLLKKVRPGDTIYFDSVSRMSRNSKEGFSDYEQLFHQGVRLIFLNEPHINTDVYRDALAVKIPLTETKIDIILEAVQRYLLEVARQFIIDAFDQAEKEVTDLHKKTREGVETARREGKQIGRRPGQKVVTKKSIDIKKKMLKHCKAFGNGTMSNKEFIEVFGIQANTFYKYKRELLEETHPTEGADSSG